MNETKVPLSFSSTQSVALWAVIPLIFLMLNTQPFYTVVFSVIALAMAVFSISDWGSNNIHSMVALAVSVVTLIAASINYLYPVSIDTIGYSNMVRVLLGLFALDLILVISLSNKWRNMMEGMLRKPVVKGMVNQNG